MVTKIKKIFYFLVSTLLILSALSACVLSYNGEPEPVKVWGPQDIRTMKTSGYYTSLSKDAVTYKTDNVKGHSISWKVGRQHINYVQIELEEPLTSYDSLMIDYSNDPNGYIYPKDSITGHLIGNGNIISFYLPNLPDASALRLHIDSEEEFSIKQISVYYLKGTGTTLNFNVIAACVFGGILLVLLIIEKKFGYFKWLLKKVKNEIAYCKELSTDNKIYFVLHVSALAITAVFLITAFIVTLIYGFSKITFVMLFIMATLSLVLQLCDRLVSKRHAEPAKLFFVSALLLGVMFSCTMPVTTHVSWDDGIHFRNMYSITDPQNAEGSLAKWKLSTDSYKVSEYKSNPREYVNRIIQEDSIPLDYEYPSVTTYTLISYSPMLSATVLLRLMRVDIAKIIFMTHFVDAMFFAILSYLAIKKLKSGAYIASAVILLPGVIFLGSALGYDFWLTAWLTYAACYTISLFQDAERKITAKDMFIIFAAFFIGCSAKPLYMALMIPLLFIPKSKFRTPPHSRIYKFLTVAVMAVIVAAVLIPGLISGGLYTDDRGGSDVNSVKQIVYALTHPLEYGRTLIKHLGKYCSLKNFVDYSANYGFLAGYHENPYAFFGSFSIVTVVFALFIDKKDEVIYSQKYAQRIRWITILSCFIQVVLISSLFYATFTNVGAQVINGCQFRYLFPILFPLFFFIIPRGIVLKVSDTFKKAVLFGALIFNALFGYFIVYITTLS